MNTGVGNKNRMYEDASKAFPAMSNYYSLGADYLDGLFGTGEGDEEDEIEGRKSMSKVNPWGDSLSNYEDNAYFANGTDSLNKGSNPDKFASWRLQRQANTVNDGK